MTPSITETIFSLEVVGEFFLEDAKIHNFEVRCL